MSSSAGLSGERSSEPAVAPAPSAPILAFLYADPAAHSLSPAMHNAAFAHAGIPGQYEARRVPPQALAREVAALRHAGVLGANLSLPHKEAVTTLLDELSAAARAIGSVNTIVVRDGHLNGDNTDAPGLIHALRDAQYAFAPGAQVVVVGAGGAARAAVYALQQAGQQVQIMNRTHARAQALARDFSPAPRPDLFGVQAARLSELPWTEVQLLINASSAGLDDLQQSPLPGFDFQQLPDDALVYDMVYRPAETRLMREARAAGRRAENGLGMLAHQARLAFTLWTERDVPVEVFLKGAEAAMVALKNQSEAQGDPV